VYNDSYAPVAGPKAANLAGNKRLPNLVRIVPLGASNAYLVYALTRDNNHPDHPEIREAYGQTTALATGAAAGSRTLLIHRRPKSGILSSALRQVFPTVAQCSHGMKQMSSLPRPGASSATPECRRPSISTSHAAAIQRS
jgi:hypothetical protein